MDSIVSRESSFLFNNLILLASCFAVLWGTLFPVLSEAVTGEKMTVGAPFFNRVNVPIGLFLLFLTGVGPLIAWRRSSLDSLRRNFFYPTIAGVVLMIALAAAGVRHFYALMTFGLSLFVVWTIMAEFYKGSRAISAKTGQNLLMGAVELTHRNTRRYGGYIVHMGIVLMFIGFAGAAFNLDTVMEVSPGRSFQLGRYDLKVANLDSGENDNYTWNRATLEVSSGGRQIGTLLPEHRVYKASRQPTSEVAIRRRLNEDLFTNFEGMSEDGQRAIIRAFVFPLVSWIWIGFWVLFVGSLVCLVPAKTRFQYARTQVVGVAGKYDTVQK